MSYSVFGQLPAAEPVVTPRTLADFHPLPAVNVTRNRTRCASDAVIARSISRSTVSRFNRLAITQLTKSHHPFFATSLFSHSHIAALLSVYGDVEQSAHNADTHSPR